MTKSKTIIATLGIVAGLGAAALPLTSFATGKSVTGAVDLEVTVEDAIAMTITSSGDSSAVYYAENPDNAAGNWSITGTEFVIANDNTRAVSSASTSMLPNRTDTSMTSAVTVYTNAGSGYSLGVKSSGAMTSNENNTIAALTSTGSTLTAGTNGGQWGIYWGSEEVGASTVFKNDTSDMSITTTGATGTTHNIVYGVATDADQPTGVYKATVTYTATNN